MARDFTEDLLGSFGAASTQQMIAIAHIQSQLEAAGVDKAFALVASYPEAANLPEAIEKYTLLGMPVVVGPVGILVMAIG
jgi:hypothetical protein